MSEDIGRTTGMSEKIGEMERPLERDIIATKTERLQPSSSSLSSLVIPMLGLITALLTAAVVLDSIILKKGLSGDFIPAGFKLNIEGDETSSSTTTMGGPPAITDGLCQVKVSLQVQGSYPIGLPMDWHKDDNIIVQLPDASNCDVAVSPTWTVAAWNYTIIHLTANSIFKPPKPAKNERQLIKILRGSLLDVNLNGVFDSDGHWETYVVTPPNRPISLFIDDSINEIKAGADGSVFVYIKVTTEALDTPITDMTEAPATIVGGPYSENFKWNNFGKFFSAFDGVEFYNMAGILLQDNDGSRLCYMQFWTMREDQHADGYHNHANLNTSTAFAEIHMATYAANGVSGMQTTLPGTSNLRYIPNPSNISSTEKHAYNENNQTGIQIAIPMPPGHAHGPLWSVDPTTGEPTLICAGGVQYPYHRWLIESNGPLNSPLRYSMWVAFEHRPEDATVPLKMLTQWPNAYLQSTIDVATCN